MNGIPQPKEHFRILPAIGRRLAATLSILATIVFLTQLGLHLAERGRFRLPVEPLPAIGEALAGVFRYIFSHPQTYLWRKETVPAFELVSTLLLNSAGLLLASLIFAALAGVLLGTAAAVLRRKASAPLMLLVSVLGISTPSFLLGMLFWVFNTRLYPYLGLETAPFPPTGFGWDAHLILPGLVLAARPLAQIMQVTYVRLTEVLAEEYIRAARAKGNSQRLVLLRHALPNALIPILNTLSASLRYSLASLPVVETFFLWPGIGSGLLQAIDLRLGALVTDLIVSLGLIFLIINLTLDLLYPYLDPRLRQDSGEMRQDSASWRERWLALQEALTGWWGSLRNGLASISSRMNRRLPRNGLPLPKSSRLAFAAKKPGAPATGKAGEIRLDEPQAGGLAKKPALRSAFFNAWFVSGSLLILLLTGLAFFGHRLSTASPYTPHGVMFVDGVIGVPPFAPSQTFPWGSDAVGRDLQSLVLHGARQTLTLAFFGMAARVLLGLGLGMLAGWWRNSLLDRLIQAAISVWAAFPVTIFAMITILALGIQRGMSVFIIAICLVGWGEIVQFVRGQVISLKPQLYVEAAQSVGARSGQILIRHLFPVMLPSVVVMAVLEMGAVLMLLAELGFLNIFLGGGFKVEYGEGAGMTPIILYFSDVPEWGALLANIRYWWRSNPWLAWYPGLAFFISILAFNLWGEGLRRFLDESRLNLSRLINRYSLLAAALLIFGVFWTLRSAAPMEVYRPQAQQFDARRALSDIEELASPAYAGRESGTPGAGKAAGYIAARMEEIGLFPGGERNTYLQALTNPRFHLTEIPQLEIVDAQGETLEKFRYREDFVELVGATPNFGEVQGAVVGIAIGRGAGGSPQEKNLLAGQDISDKIVVVREESLDRLNRQMLNGLLVVSEDEDLLRRKYLYPRQDGRIDRLNPALIIPPRVADLILASAGSSLKELDAMTDQLQPDQAALTRPGARLRLAISGSYEVDPDEEYIHVIGFIPGSGSQQVEGLGGKLDNQVIMISAYYDGLGTGPDGVFYPGANDNASGVAAMLEMARLLKQAEYQPKKTLVFVAWSGGERLETLSTNNIMNAKTGFNNLTIEAVIELSGVGGGGGEGLALAEGSSFRLVNLFEDAASRFAAPITTRGRGPHFAKETRIAFGGRTALSAYLSWDGSDLLAHTPEDTPERIELDKLEKAGQTALLVVTTLSREVDY